MRSRTGLCSIAVAAMLLTAVSAFGTTINVPGDYTTIQAAVDAAAPSDVIVIAAGTYTEQVHIQTSDISLSGAGVGVTIVKSPATLTEYYSTSYDHYPVVFIDSATGVSMSDLTVDGDRKGNANYKFEGVSFWDSDGALTDVDVVRVMDDPFSGAQHGVGIYSYNDTGGPYSIVLTDVLVDDYQKTGVALLGSGLTVDMTRVITIGEGATTVTAQNGIQTGYGSGGTLTDCEIYDNWYVGDTWTASGFLPQIGGAVDVEGAIIDGNQTSVYTYDNDCAMSGCDVTGCGGSAVIAYASGAKAGGGSAPLLPSPIGEEYTPKGTRGDMDFTADGCTFTGTDVVDEAGIYPYGVGDVLTVTITDGDLGHWDYAVLAYEDGGTIDMALHGNSFHDNGSYAAYVVTALPQNFEENWWGDAAGPSPDAKSGGAVSEKVDYSPWYAAPPGTDPMPVGTNDSIQDAINAAAPGATINVMPGTYDESVVFDSGFDTDGLLIDGDASDRAIITGGVRFLQTADIDGITFRDLVFKGIAAGGNAIIDFDQSGAVNDFALDNCVIDGEAVADRNGLTGNKLGQSLTVTDTEVVDVYGWSVMDFDSSYGGPPVGGNELPLTSVLFAGNQVHECNGTVSLRGNHASQTPQVDVYDNVFANIGGNGGAQGMQWAALELNHAVLANVHHNQVSGVVEGEYGEGQAFQMWDVGTLNFHNNLITDNFQGIYFYGGSAGGAYGGPYAVPGGAVEYSSFVGNAQYGVSVDPNCTGGPLDAEYSWWGDASGPATSKGTGDKALGAVDYDPWIGKPLEGGNIVCDPDPLDLTEGATSGNIDVNYLGGGGGLMFGYSVTVTWDDTVADLTGITQGSLLLDAAATQFFAYGSGNTRTIDCVLLGAQDGVTGPGTMFTLAYTADSYGETPVDITIVKIRDKDNQPLSGFYEDDGLIRVDTDAPVVADTHIENVTLSHTDDYAKDHDYLELTATVTDDYGLGESDILANFSTLLVGGGSAVPAEDYTSNVATWTLALEDVELKADGVKTVTITVTDGLGNVGTGSDDIEVDNTAPGKVTGFDASPAHEEVALSWDDASGADANYYGVLVRYDAWGDYPLYDAAAPDYPADETAGDGEAFSGDATGAVHSIVPRDIHYYSAFVYDWALNYGPVDSGGQDRATNYWLGDVANVANAWVPDGYVSDPDITKLSGTYGGAPAGEFTKCDVGPTDDYSRVGIPEPDDFINFEDLMMFAMNYDVVMPRIVPFLDGTPDGALMLALHELRSEDGVFDVAIRLEGNTGEVKGLSAVLSYDPAALEFVSAAVTDEMYSPLAPVFFWSGQHEGEVQVDLAVLGTGMTIGGSGDVAVLTFRALGSEFALGYESAVLRGAENENLTAELEGLESKPEMPTVFRLVQNSPNPFNPVTTVAYDVPNDAEVSVRVYDVAGRLVRTLVDGVQDAGVHAVVWDGRSDRGESVGSGIYFCVMEAHGFRDSRKMTLLK